MNRRMAAVVRIVSALLIAIPVAVVATILLLPLWRWVEASSGIESIGHSGPAEWCYLAVLALVAPGVWLVLGIFRSPGPRSE